MKGHSLNGKLNDGPLSINFKHIIQIPFIVKFVHVVLLCPNLHLKERCEGACGVESRLSQPQRWGATRLHSTHLQSGSYRKVEQGFQKMDR